MIKYLLDENLDPDILIWCEENDHVLVTNNRALRPVHLANHLKADRHVPGTLVIKKKMPWGVLSDELEFIWQNVSPAELTDQIRYLPLARPDVLDE